MSKHLTFRCIIKILLQSVKTKLSKFLALLTIFALNLEKPSPTFCRNQQIKETKKLFIYFIGWRNNHHPDSVLCRTVRQSQALLSSLCKSTFPKEFPRLVSCNRFVELQQKATTPMVIFLKTFCLGQRAGISIVHSTPLKVCHICKEHFNKLFKGMTTKG